MSNLSALLQARNDDAPIFKVAGLQTALDGKLEDPATQGVAEAGTDNSQPMTPLRTRQAIKYLTNGNTLTLSPAATVDIDLSAASYFVLDTDQNTTLTVSNPEPVNNMTLVLTGSESISTYDLGSASHESTLDVNSQDGDPLHLSFNTDGTKMFMVGTVYDRIYEYNLTTPFDLSTAIYSSTFFGVTGQDNIPRTVHFNTNGTKMYMMGKTNDMIYQYTLSTPFSLSAVTYDNVSFYIGGQDDNPQGLNISVSGTKMYLLGGTNQTVYQYTLSTAFDMSTASYDNVSVSLTAQDASAFGIEIKGDGTKFYMLGGTNDAVFQYTLSTAFDLSTISYDNVSFSVAAQIISPACLTFSPDGSRMYLPDFNNNALQQYSTSVLTASTVTYPVSFKWPNGIAPDAPADGETDVITAYTSDSGTTWYAVLEGGAMS